MRESQRSNAAQTRVTRALLRKWPLPRPSEHDDKEARGRVLIVGGEVQIPGAVILAGIAALRAGAGKLQIASCRTVAPLVGIAVPEALSIGLPETVSGSISDAAIPTIIEHAERTQALLVGPGMRVSEICTRLVTGIIDGIRKPGVVLDAGALSALVDARDVLHPLNGNVVLTPHFGEMAAMTGEDERVIAADPASAALRAAAELRAVVALKGSRTFIATPGGEMYVYRGGDIGLATSGSGDTLAGIVAGLIARGASPLQASAWAVFLHGAAGNALARKMGRVGFLARELLDEVPQIMNRL